MEPRRWAYDAFAHINRIFFGQQLPWPEILWENEAELAWLGWCDPVKLDSTVIHLHPQLLGSEGGGNPWGVPEAWLGERWAFDVLLHEATHIRVAQSSGGRHRGSSPHDNRFWVSEVNRLAPMLGFRNLVAGRLNDRTARANVPFQQVELFPYGYRKLTGTAAEHYSASGSAF